MSRSSIESKIMGLENKLKAEKERRDQFSVPKGPGLRKPLPTPLGEFKSDGTPVRPRKNLDLSFISPLPKQDPTETEAKLKEIYKMQGKLKINGSQYYATQNDLEDLGELGNGSCGHVVKMLHKPSNQVIAVKQMRRSGNTDENKRIIMDLEVVLKSHDCPYIVQCLGCFITDADVWICMELMATCFDKLLKRLNRPIPEDILGKVTVATVNALSYLKNKHGVIHRDVKPSNILLDERGRIKLCDFGISGRLVDSKAKTRSAGCAAYMAPERIDLSLADYDIRADVWSLGITLVELATGQFPYMGCNNDFEVLTKVLEEDPPTLSDHGGFSQEFQNFVNRCLTKNYQQRPKYDELLKHPFVLVYTSKDVDVAEWFRKNDLHPDKYTNLRRFSNTPPLSPKQHITRRFFTFRNSDPKAQLNFNTLPQNGLGRPQCSTSKDLKYTTINGQNYLDPKTKRHNFNFVDKYETIKPNVNHHVLNKLRNGSPSIQRRCENFEGPVSPYLSKRNVDDGFWQVNTTNKDALSPGFNRKRIQQFSVDQQTSSRSANTSPLLLERFYHQQNQHRRQASCSPQRINPARKVLFDGPASLEQQISPANDTQQEGWLDSLTGAVKRRFASCIKVQLRGNEPGTSRMLVNSSPVHHSDVPVSFDHRPRHQSPEPPPRLNRDNPASPLAIHRTYLERLSSSPQSLRRYPLTPQPPPRRLSTETNQLYYSTPSSSAPYKDDR